MPQKKPKDWKQVSADLSAAICEPAMKLNGEEQKALAKKLMAVIQHHRTHPHTDHMISDLSAPLMPLAIDINTKAELLAKILDIVQTFFNLKPMWHTSGADQ